MSCLFFFFNDTATTEIYTLSLHDALPICHPALSDGLARHGQGRAPHRFWRLRRAGAGRGRSAPHLPDVQPPDRFAVRSEEHTSELQSLAYLVCRLLLEKKKKEYNDLPPRP